MGSHSLCRTLNWKLALLIRLCHMMLNKRVLIDWLIDWLIDYPAMQLNLASAFNWLCMVTGHTQFTHRTHSGPTQWWDWHCWNTSVLWSKLLHFKWHGFVELMFARYEHLADCAVAVAQHRRMAANLVHEWLKLHKLPLAFHHTLRHWNGHCWSTTEHNHTRPINQSTDQSINHLLSNKQHFY